MVNKMEKQVQKRNEGGIYVLVALLGVMAGAALDIMGYDKGALILLAAVLAGIVYGVNKNFPRSK